MIPIEQILVILLTREKRRRQCEAVRRWRLAHPEKVTAANAVHWGKMTPEQRDRQNKLRRLRYVPHPKKRVKTAMGKAEYNRQYQKNNRVRISEQSRIWIRNRRRIDPSFRLGASLRSRVYWAMSGNRKSAGTEELLGCTIPELRAHLEALFVPGMTWENYGPVWHVDHKRPCASFELSLPAQQRECFHFTNLQPLFAAENMSKGAKIL